MSERTELPTTDERPDRCETCPDCRYFDDSCWRDGNGNYHARDGMRDDIGECRRYPPTVTGISDEGDTEMAWPEVHGEYWCGEWQPKDAPPKSARVKPAPLVMPSPHQPAREPRNR